MTESAGEFTVTGRHTYSAAATYNVQVTVTDMSGHTLNASSTVQVAPAAVTGQGSDVSATIDQSTSTATPLAVFTDPAAGTVSQVSTAKVYWGDDSSSSVAVSHVGDLAEVLASHVYQTAGMFGVETLVYNAANVLVGAAAGAGGRRWAGDEGRPEGGARQLGCTRTSSPPRSPPNSTTAGQSRSPMQSCWITATVDSGTGLVASFQALVQFANKPVDATITLKNWQKGAEAVSMTVHVVQVVVKDTATPFVASQDIKKNPQEGWQPASVTFTHLTWMDQTPVPDQGVYSPQDQVGARVCGLRLGMVGHVTLNGPDRQQVPRCVTVGFHQTIDRSDRSLDANAFVYDNMEGYTYLDGGARPWYSGNLPGEPSTSLDRRRDCEGRQAHDHHSRRQAELGDDRPISGSARFWATSTKQTFNGYLSVAAQTSDDGGSTGPALPSTHLFQEASANWSVNADGTVVTKGVDKDGSATLDARRQGGRHCTDRVERGHRAACTKKAY